MKATNLVSITHTALNLFRYFRSLVNLTIFFLFVYCNEEHVINWTIILHLFVLYVLDIQGNKK